MLKLPLLAVAVCSLGPTLVQVIVSPAWIVIVAGVNLKSEIVSPGSSPATWAARLRRWGETCSARAATQVGLDPRVMAMAAHRRAVVPGVRARGVTRERAGGAAAFATAPVVRVLLIGKGVQRDQKRDRGDDRQRGLECGNGSIDRKDADGWINLPILGRRMGA